MDHQQWPVVCYMQFWKSRYCINTLCYEISMFGFRLEIICCLLENWGKELIKFLHNTLFVNSMLGAYENVFVTLKKHDWDTSLYIFSKGDEFWFSMVEPPPLLEAIRSNFTYEIYYCDCFQKLDHFTIENNCFYWQNALSFWYCD